LVSKIPEIFHEELIDKTDVLIRFSNEKERIDELAIVFSFCNYFDLSSIAEESIKILISPFLKGNKESDKQIMINRLKNTCNILSFCKKISLFSNFLEYFFNLRLMILDDFIF
jgi:hypothetical protein